MVEKLEDGFDIKLGCGHTIDPSIWRAVTLGKARNKTLTALDCYTCQKYNLTPSELGMILKPEEIHYYKFVIFTVNSNDGSTVKYNPFAKEYVIVKKGSQALIPSGICPICQEKLEIGHTDRCSLSGEEIVVPYRLNCGHYFSLGDLREAYQNKIRTGIIDGFKKLICLKEGCGEKLVPEDYKYLLSEETLTTLRNCIPDVKGKERRRCRKEGCPAKGRVFYVPDGDGPVKCPGCGGEIRLKIELERDEKAREEARKIGAAYCPGCRKIILRREGCNHMTCTICSPVTNFCYLCWAKLDPNNINGHFKDNSPFNPCAKP